jgi:predicted PolB exonuclease-like 3'-5' exonuclease
MDLLALYQPRASAPLDELAKLMGLPGKLGMDGSAVWSAWQAGRATEIRDYCETDVANTFLVYLRFQLMRGVLTRKAYAKEVGAVRAALSALKQPHWEEFLAAWQQGAL